MDWNNIVSIIMGVVVVAGLFLALRNRNKSGQKKTEDLYRHLIGLGIEAYPEEEEIVKARVKRSRSERALGVIKIKRRNVDCIEIIGIASQYGTYYFLDYIVRSPNLSSLKPEKTVLVKKKKRHPGGKVLQIHWVGDKYLAQSLNLDYHLESKLLQAQFKGKITIIPDKKEEYTRIRTGYFLPSPDFFEAVDLIAGHIRAAYG